jgi:hypothetical protein
VNVLSIDAEGGIGLVVERNVFRVQQHAVDLAQRVAIEKDVASLSTVGSARRRMADSCMCTPIGTRMAP